MGALLVQAAEPHSGGVFVHASFPSCYAATQYNIEI